MNRPPRVEDDDPAEQRRVEARPRRFDRALGKEVDEAPEGQDTPKAADASDAGTPVEVDGRVIRDVPLDQIEPVDLSQLEFRKLDRATMHDGLLRLSGVRDLVHQGWRSDEFFQDDAARGESYESGRQRIFDAFYRSNAIALDAGPDGRCTIINGRHRIGLARELGLRSLPAVMFGSPDRLPLSGTTRAGAPERDDREPAATREHLVPAHVFQELDGSIARMAAEHDSRIQDRDLTAKDARVLKGDAGEGHALVDLATRYGHERVLRQPRFEDDDLVRTPDFAVISDRTPGKISEIVDAKAWSLTRPRGPDGHPVSDDASFARLQEQPEPSSLLNMTQLREVVERYGSSPRLEAGGRVVLYFPEDVIRYAPQVKAQIEGWSGTSVARGHAVEVRSMGVWERDLLQDVRERRLAEAQRQAAGIGDGRS